jgi:hypothetical protein
MIPRADLGLNEGGFVKIHRKLLDSWVAERMDWLGIWVTMIALANWKPAKTVVDGNMIELQRGQFSHSQRYLCTRFNTSHKGLRHLFKLLEQDGMIDRTRTGRGQHIITICNYEEYQAQGRSQGTVEAQSGHSEGTKYKNTKNLKNNNIQDMPTYGLLPEVFTLENGVLEITNETERARWEDIFGGGKSLRAAMAGFTPAEYRSSGDLQRHARHHLNHQAQKVNRPKAETTRPQSLAKYFK